MGGTPKETTTKNEPWDGAQGYLTDVYSQYNNLIKNGAPKQWEGPTVADLSDPTKQSQQQQINYAINPANTAGLQAGQNATTAITNGSAFNPTGQNALAAGTTYNNAGIGALQGASQSAATANPALAYLQGTASGANIGNNPWLQQNIANNQQKIADQLGNITLPGLSGQAAGLGRSGSNAFANQVNNATSTAADAMSKVAVDAYQNQYNQDVANQLTAANQYGGLVNQGTQNQISAGSALAGANQNQQDSRNNAASLYQQGQNAQANTQLQGAGMAADQYTNGLLPSSILGQVGQAQDDRNQNILNNNIQRYEAGQQQQLSNLGNFANLLNGGGYSNTTTPVYSNTGGQVLGGLTSLLGLFASDEHIKTIHRHVGFMDNGLAVYEWSYKADPEQHVYTGPMAQDVEEIMPHAVVEFGGVKHIVMDRFLEAA